MTVSELAIEKNRQIGRDVAFDLLLDRASKGFGDILAHASIFLLIFVVGAEVGHLATWLPMLLPVAALPVPKMAALLGMLAWLGYGFFGISRRSRIERQLLIAQINTLRLQQLAEQS